MKKILFFLLLGALLHSCSEKEDPSKSEYPNGILVKTNPDLGEGDWVGWIVIHSRDGSFTGMHKIARGGSASFESLDQAYYHLTYFVKTIRSGGTEVVFGTTMLDVPVGKIYTLGMESGNFDSPNVTGEFKILISRDPDIMGAYSSSSNGILSNSSSFFPNLVEINQGIAKNSNNYMVVAYDKFGEFRYKNLTNIADQQQYEVNFSEMKPFDKTIPVPFSMGSLFEVTTLEDDGNKFKVGHVLTSSRHGNFSPQTSYKLGFLNDFDLYMTNVSYLTDGNRFSFTKVGAAPSSIDFPEAPNYENWSLDKNNFHFQGPDWMTNYQLVYNSILQSDGKMQMLTQTIIGESETFFLEMPKELINEIPLLGRDDVYTSNYFNLYNSSFSYQDMIQNNLVSRPSRFEFETYLIGYSLK